MSGRKGGKRVTHKKKPLSHGWVVVTSKTYPDRVYFYNTVTKCSTWENPCENLSDEEYNSSSSEYSSPGRQKSVTSHSKKQKNKVSFNSSKINSNHYINHEIEDYDEEQDQYFNNFPIDSLALSRSKRLSPSSSPESVSSENLSDSERHSSSILLENNKKKLWVHFVSSPEKPTVKKSLALCDFDKPTTSRNLGMEGTSGKKKKKSWGSSGESCSAPKCDKDSHSFMRKKEKNSERRKNSTEKAVKNVSFKRTDKTPAQTRLLKLRKQNAERLKEMAIKFPDFIIPKNNDTNLKKGKSSSTSELNGETRNDSFSEAYLKRIEIFNNNQEGGSHFDADCVEEMDWEPSNVESDVKNINVIRQQLNKTTEISRDIFFGLNSDHSVTLSSQNSLILVLDTNIFVSCLDFVKEIRDTKIPGLGYPVIYVPWRTLQELDHLKDTKIDTIERHIHANVRKAIAYLNENFKSKHPRIFGQSFEDFAKMVDVETFAPDDEILQTCIKFQKINAEKKLMLLTNDKNLESKALVSGVEAHSKDSFMKKYLTTHLPANTSNSSNNEGAKRDDCLCQVKLILKSFLPMFVETEMRIAFEGDWLKLAVKKPPWTLQDALECLLKHWRSVFFLILSKETRTEAENLYERLYKREPASTEDLAEVIRTIQRLLISIKKYQRKKRPYLDIIPITVTKLSSLLRTLSPSHSRQDESGEPTSSFAGVSQQVDPIHNQVSQRSSEDISKVKTLFKDLWDSLRSFCCSMSDVIHSSDVNNYAVVQEIRLKVSQILSEVGELVMTVEKIFQMNVCDINENHPLISHFSNFLIRVYPAMAPDLMGDLPRCLALFFTDFEGRSLLSSSLNDFKEFIQDLSKATEYFDSQPTC